MRFFLLFFLLIVPSFVLAAHPDLSISAQDIRFSQEQLIAGQKVRLYARVKNVGDQDMVGFVTFFQGSDVLENTQVISLPKGGFPEEVYIDFIVPGGEFNLRAEVRGTEPEDVDLSNNTAITGMFYPVLDQDLDGVADGVDNCPQQSNSTQTDTDGDGVGDVCDDDDDQDSLTDGVESELNTNPLLKDTDGDGAMDPDDAYPLDPSKQKVQVVIPSKILDKIAEQVMQTTKAVEPPAVEKVSEPTKEEAVPMTNVEVDPLTFSPHAVFTYQRQDWKTYAFAVAGSVEGMYHYEWDFGDGVRSNKTEVTHAFPRSGAYEVVLIVRDAQGLESQERVTILVPFLSLQNRWVLLLIALLVIILVAGGWLLWRRPKPTTNHLIDRTDTDQEHV